MEEILTLRESIIKRPGMYFGNIDIDGANNPVYELLANAIDQFLVGEVKTIKINIEGQNISVSDDGSGFNFDEKKIENDLSSIENFLIFHHNSPTADNHAPHIHVQNGGLGLAILNVASTNLKIESCHKNVTWTQEFSKGEILTSAKSEVNNCRKGTTVSLTMDKEIFGSNKPNIIEIRKVVFETVHLYPELTIKLNNETFCSQNGLLDFGLLITKPNCHTTDFKQFRFTTLKNNVSVQAVAIGTTNEKTQVHSWVNGSRTVENGSHVEGFKKALNKSNWNPEIVLIHVIMHNPQYAGPCKDAIVNNEVLKVVESELSIAVQQFLLH